MHIIICNTGLLVLSNGCFLIIEFTTYCVLIAESYIKGLSYILAKPNLQRVPFL